MMFMVMITSFSLDEYAKWITLFFHARPRRIVVSGKYIVSVFDLDGAVMSPTSLMVYAFGIDDRGAYRIFVTVISFIFISIILPVHKFGVERVDLSCSLSALPR